jgi:hypothetical protein
LQIGENFFEREDRSMFDGGPRRVLVARLVRRDRRGDQTKRDKSGG